ncbi:MAG TPA: thiamine-phosphate kinase [Gemmatimonadaceae bacterium]|nr:thiamine-phosphate kinase [Gemmatimonadaceae bacterium]
MSDEIPMGPGAEFDAIRQMLERWGPRAVGIGDDAAVMHVARGDSLVVSVDTFVEGRHFLRGWLTPREIGFRAVAAALSDIAAMAARPTGVLIALNLPEYWNESLIEIADGIGEMVDLAQTCIRGGNLSDGTELSVTTTVLGEAFAPLARRGARAGDRVYVTGRFGGPGAATALLYAGESAGDFRDRFARPVPRLAEAVWLAERGASAAIDVSDGLLADVGHLAVASGVDISMDATRVPLMDGVEIDAALRSGEEYELVVTSSELDVAAFERRFAIPLTEIGHVTDSRDGCVHVSGARVANVRGYDHLSR